MKRIGKPYIIFLFLFISVVINLGLQTPFGTNSSFIYIALISFFSIPIFYHISFSPTKTESIVILLGLAIVGQILVIDPIEPGLYGKDSYDNLERLYILYSNSIDTVKLLQLRGWPQLFILSDILIKITTIDLELVAKYIPMLSLGIPPIIYLYSYDLTGSKYISFLSGLALLSSKTFLGFQTKFVPEFIGMLLFFTLLLVYSLRSTRVRWVIPILAAGIVLSHPIVAIAAMILIFSYITLYKWGRTQSLFYKYKPNNLGGLSVSISNIIIFSSFFTFVYGFVITERVFMGVLATTYATEGYSAGIPRSALHPNLLLADFGSLFVLITLSFCLLYGFFSSYQMSTWEMTFATTSAVLSVYYAIEVLISIPFPLSGSRLLTYLVPLLFCSSIFVMFRIFGRTNIGFRRVSGIVLIIFIISQTMSIPYNVANSDPVYTVPGTENHPTIGGRAASDWAVEYSHNGIIEGKPKYVIRRGGLNNINPTRCRFYERQDIPKSINSDNSKSQYRPTYYDSGHIQISDCIR